MACNHKSINKEVVKMKYAITLTKENTKTVLYVSETKEEAMAFGDKKCNELMRNDGVLSCIRAEFDENNNIIGNRYSLIHTWH